MAAGVHSMESSGERRALPSKRLQGPLLPSPALQSHPILHHHSTPPSHLEPNVLVGLERIGSGNLSDEQLGGLDEEQLLAALNPHLIMRMMCGMSRSRTRSNPSILAGVTSHRHARCEEALFHPSRRAGRCACDPLTHSHARSPLALD